MSALPQAKLYPIQGPEIVFEIEPSRPLIPDGTYTAVCIGCDVKHLFKTLKVFFRFRIAEGPHAGIVLFRAYRVAGRIIAGKGPGSGPRPKLKRRSDLFQMLSRVLRLPVNTKLHRVSFRELERQLCKVSTRTVKHDSKQQSLDEPYSVVADVLSIEAGTAGSS